MLKDRLHPTKEVGISKLWQTCALFSFHRAYTCGNDAFSSITKNSGVKSNIKPPPPPATLILDTHTFDEVVLVSRFVCSHESLGPTRIS